MVLAREISVEESAMAGCGGGGGGGVDVHAQMVAYVAALSGRAPAAGCGVWREHSYARAARRGAGAGAGGRHAPRTLLAPPDADSDSPDADAPLDVGSELQAERAAGAALPLDALEEEREAGADGGDEEWEARVAALAPSAAHARLAARAADVLRDLRLARLASSHAGRALRQEQARAAAYKLRRALAPTWLWSGACGAGGAGGAGAGGGGAAWLYSVLSAYLPRPLRALLEEALDELRRVAPRLAARLPAPGRAPPPDPLSAEAAPPAPPPPGGACAPLLVWVSAGRARADARWERRLRALLWTRTVGTGAVAAGFRAAPDVWCAAQAGAARAQLNDVLAEAGSRPVFLAGSGAGAALCCALAAGVAGAGAGGERGGERRVRGVALLGPALVSAEGEEGAEARAPALVVAGGGGGRAAALELCAGGGGARRLVLVEGADDALRLPARLRQRLRVPQHALDAAIVEEVARWVRELAEQDEEEDTTPAHERSGDVIDTEEEDEYAHLPSPWTPSPAPAPNPSLAPPPAPTHSPSPAPALVQQPIVNAGGGTRAIEIVEGRVVSRVSGCTPLVLTPRRAPPPAPGPVTPGPSGPVTPGPPAPADIMQMPIVFADDEPAPLQLSAPDAPATTSGAPVTVTSGGGRGGAALKYTRVIVAKRGASAGGPPPPAGLAAPSSAPGPGRGPAPDPGPRASRPVLLRRAVRVMGRVRSRPQKEQ